MITSILSKCLTELGSEKPDLSYIKGMLEVLLASQPITKAPAVLIQTSTPTAEIPHDEASVLDAKAKAALQRVKAATIIE